MPKKKNNTPKITQYEQSRMEDYFHDFVLPNFLYRQALESFVAQKDIMKKFSEAQLDYLMELWDISEEPVEVEESSEEE